MDVLSAGVLTLLLLLAIVECNKTAVHLLPTATPCAHGLSIQIIKPHLLANGSILSDDGYVYKKEDYWEDHTSVDNNASIYRGCACVVNSCVRKCCPENHMYSPTVIGKCVFSEDPLLKPFTPPHFQHHDGDVVTDYHPTTLRVLYGDPCTAGKYALKSHEKYSIDGNGTMFLPAADNQSDGDIITADKYCLEVFFDTDGYTRVTPFVCFPPEEEDDEMSFAEKATFILYPIVMIISLPFLLATFVVYAIVPELRNLHGKSLMSHVATLFFAYLFLIILQLGGDAIGITFCIVSAFIIYFAFLASFFWLNVMCFDLWWTFSGFRPLRGSVRERDHKKFVVYSLYSWGSPLILLTIALIMELAEVVPDHLLKPQFGIDSCWFKENEALWAYFYGPVAVILTANLIMFVTTAWKIIQLKRETAMLQGTDSRRHDDDENKQRFSLYLKLFIVMGVNWAMEVISHAAGGPVYLWYITDIGNTLQGVLIFIIFVWKDKVRKLLVKRFTGKAGDSHTQNSSSGSKSTRVYSSANASIKKDHMSGQGDFNMAPISRSEGARNVP